MNFSNSRTGILFRQAQSVDQSPFEKLFEVCKELITHTSGDFDEAIDWLRELDEEYQLTDENYTIDDFIDDLLDKGYVKAEIKPDGSERSMGITAKTEKLLREYALKQIFGKLRKSGLGNHNTQHQGAGDDKSGDLSGFQFGDSLENIVLTESIKNAQIHSGIGDYKITEDDLVVEKNHHKSQMSTVLMIDIRHSMILYGEDRITPAKKVAIGVGRIHHHPLSQRHSGYLGLWKRCPTHIHQRIALFTSGALPYQHRCWFGSGNGHASKKKKYQQTNIYDYRRQTQLPQDARW